MRNEFAAELTQLASEDSRLLVLSGDIGNQLFDKFKAQHPDRFFNCGVAEANMMSLAAGLAMCGMRPVCYTITPFTTTRCLEQIRVDVCYHEQPVTIVGVGAGLAYANLGGTHHSCEDIAFLRVLPHMQVVCAGDAWEARATMRAALQQDRPVYLRLGKKGEPLVHAGYPDGFAIGRAIRMRQGHDACLMSTGNMLPSVMEASDALERQGVSAEVVSFHTVKPLDEGMLTSAIERFPVVVTIEEHSLLGGFGAAVAEWMADRGPSRTRLLRLGTADTFLHVTGEQEFARHHFGLGVDQIASRTREALAAARPK